MNLFKAKINEAIDRLLCYCGFHDKHYVDTGGRRLMRVVCRRCGRYFKYLRAR